MNKYDLAIIGGGAAGFFAAIRYAELQPSHSVAIFEKKSRVLEKVKVSGGGRCNVTHDWSEPELAHNYYPRGHDFLQVAFKEFHCQDMREWLHKNGVDTKVESDGRVFPVSNRSSSIIDCFMQKIKELGITLHTQQGLRSLQKEKEDWTLETSSMLCMSKRVLLAAGSNRPTWELLREMGHRILSPVASLFAFTAIDKNWSTLAGLSVQEAHVKLVNSDYVSNGPLLITHKGLSGPAILKLSAWAARELERRNYRFTVEVNWINKPKKECLPTLKALRDSEAKKNPAHLNPFGLPKRLNQHLFDQADIATIKMGEVGNKALEKWANLLSASSIEIEGKVTNKDEFVTCGGVDLEEVSPETFESKLHKNLYFAGEILDIDAITGGFNFQACWSGANLAVKVMT